MAASACVRDILSQLPHSQEASEMAERLHGVLTPHAPAASPAGPPRVVIAEGQGLVRAGFRLLLERDGDAVVVADAATSDEAVAVTRATLPDVVLMDLDLPGDGGLEATRRILAEAATSRVRVMMVMTTETDDAVFSALRAGAKGLLLKDAAPGDLPAAVCAVADGHATLAPALARRLVDHFVAQPVRIPGTPEQLDELTPREREVMMLVACGLRNEEIAERLVVTRATAKTHVSRVLCKLGVRDRAQLVVLAYEIGLVQPGADAGTVTGPPAFRHGQATVTPIGRARSGARRRRLLSVAS
jgi:DNA-binding NarL/FixJ family response regulator